MTKNKKRSKSKWLICYTAQNGRGQHAIEIVGANFHCRHLAPAIRAIKAKEIVINNIIKL